MSDRRTAHEVVIPASSESSAETIVGHLDELGLKVEKIDIREVPREEQSE